MRHSLWKMAAVMTVAAFVVSCSGGSGDGAPSSQKSESDGDVPVAEPSGDAAPDLTEEKETEVVGGVPAVPAPTEQVSDTALVVEGLDDIVAALGALTLADVRDADAYYDRDTYQPVGWGDADGDCQNDRHEILEARSLVTVTFSSDGCFVDTGEWSDAYSGENYTSADEVTIDHVVPLSHAHETGAWAWADASRQAFSADLANPGAHSVVGQAVNSEKGNQGPEQWRPTMRAAWCSYAVSWVGVKYRWDLGVSSQAEAVALTEMLDTCVEPGTDGPRIPGVAPDVPLLPPVITPEPRPEPSPTPSPEPVSDDAGPQLVSCSRQAETVVIRNPSPNSASMTGWTLHDEGDKHSYSFPGVTIPGDGSVTIRTGPDASEPIVWKTQNVWNNDGDTAYLIAPDGTTQTSRC